MDTMPRYVTVYGPKWMKVYKDSREGCRQLIAEETELEVTDDLVLIADPNVHGVWLAVWPKDERALILYPTICSFEEVDFDFLAFKAQIQDKEVRLRDLRDQQRADEEILNQLYKGR